MESDEATLQSLKGDVAKITAILAELEFKRMFSGEQDESNCFLDINAGSGGTEAQDWAQMLFRMYCRYGERKGFKVEVLEESDGDVAGLKSASIKLTGDLRTVICALRPVFTALYAKAPLIATRAATHHSRLYLFIPKSMIRFK